VCLQALNEIETGLYEFSQMARRKNNMQFLSRYKLLFRECVELNENGAWNAVICIIVKKCVQ
jgi:hypothetical protein